MRSFLKEEWNCVVILLKVYEKDIYFVVWSVEIGIVVSMGIDGIIGLYGE